MTRAIDCLVNVDFGDRAQQPEWMIRVKEDTFKGGDSFFQSPELDQLIENMDANGVEKAILITGVGATGEHRAIRFAEARPDRFALAMGGFNLLRPMKALAALESFVRDHPVAYAVVGPSFWGDGSTRRATPCTTRSTPSAASSDLPLCINTGIPGPPIPGEVQNPIHLDRVCVRFPELKLCMIHGADPWWDIAIRLLIKYSQPAPDDVGLVAEAAPGEPAALHADARARTASSSPPTTRCSRWSGAWARPPPSTSPKRSGTTGSTPTRSRSSSARRRTDAIGLRAGGSAGGERAGRPERGRLEALSQQPVARNVGMQVVVEAALVRLAQQCQAVEREQSLVTVIAPAGDGARHDLPDAPRRQGERGALGREVDRANAVRTAVGFRDRGPGMVLDEGQKTGDTRRRGVPGWPSRTVSRKPWRAGTNVRSVMDAAFMRLMPTFMEMQSASRSRMVRATKGSSWHWPANARSTRSRSRTSRHGDRPRGRRPVHFGAMADGAPVVDPPSASRREERPAGADPHPQLMQLDRCSCRQPQLAPPLHACRPELEAERRAAARLELDLHVARRRALDPDDRRLHRPFQPGDLAVHDQFHRRRHVVEHGRGDGRGKELKLQHGRVRDQLHADAGRQRHRGVHHQVRQLGAGPVGKSAGHHSAAEPRLERERALDELGGVGERDRVERRRHAPVKRGSRRSRNDVIPSAMSVVV